MATRGFPYKSALTNAPGVARLYGEFSIENPVKGAIAALENIGRIAPLSLVGTVGTATDVSANVDMYLADPDDAANFSVGQKLRVSATVGGALRTGEVEVASVHVGLGKITATGDWDTGIAAIAIGDYVYDSSYDTDETTIKLATPADAGNFSAGMVCRVSATVGGALRTGTVEVDSVDTGAGTVTFTGAVTAGIAAAVVGDYIYDNTYATGGTVIKLTSAADAANFTAGDVLKISAQTDGTSLRTGTVEVDSVDTGAGTVTATGNWTAGVAAVAYGDSIYIEDNAEITSQDCSFGTLSRLAVGKFRIVLNEPHVGGCLGLKVTASRAGGSVTSVASIDTDESAVATEPGLSLIDFFVFDADGNAVDLYPSTTMQLRLSLKGSGVGNG
jgi:hypothetical protein